MTHLGLLVQAGGLFGCVLEQPRAWPWEADSVVMGGFLKGKGCFLRADTGWGGEEGGGMGLVSIVESFVLCLEGLSLKDPPVWASEDSTCL